MTAGRDATVTAAQVEIEQCWQDPGALTRNTDRLIEHYTAIADDTDLVVFPELSLTGYIPLKGYDQRRKRLLAEVAHRAFHDELPRLQAATAGRRAATAVGFMQPSTMRHEVYNSLGYLQDGALLAVYRKQHLPVEENHYFVPGDETMVVHAAIGRVGLSICYDLVFPEVARLLALQGAEIMLAPSNWLDIANLRRNGAVLPAARAIEGQMHVVFVNGVGMLEVRGRRWPLFGRSRIVSATGEVLARGDCGPEMVTATLTAADLEAGSDVFPLLRDRRPDLYGQIAAPLSTFAS